MAITIQITDADLKKRHPNMANNLWAIAPTLIAKSDGVIDYDARTLTSATADFSSVSVGDTCIIKGYDVIFEVTAVDSGVITLDQDIGTADATAQTFQLGGFTDQIAEAWRTINNAITDRGYDVDDLTATDSFKNAQKYKALEIIFRDFRQEAGDIYDMLMQDYASLYTAAFQQTRIDDDGDETTLDDGFTIGCKVQL